MPTLRSSPKGSAPAASTAFLYRYRSTMQSTFHDSVVCLSMHCSCALDRTLKPSIAFKYMSLQTCSLEGLAMLKLGTSETPNPPVGTWANYFPYVPHPPTFELGRRTRTSFAYYPSQTSSILRDSGCGRALLAGSAAGISKPRRCCFNASSLRFWKKTPLQLGANMLARRQRQSVPNISVILPPRINMVLPIDDRSSRLAHELRESYRPLPLMRKRRGSMRG